MMNHWRLSSSFILQSIWKIEDDKTAKEQIIHATKKRRNQDLALNKDKDTCDRKLIASDVTFTEKDFTNEHWADTLRWKSTGIFLLLKQLINHQARWSRNSE